MTRKAVWLGAAWAAAGALTIAACGGSDSPTGPSGGGTSAATITIGADGRVSPSSVTVPLGSRVTFVNNHSQPHEMSSDPHPEHNQCPDINVGTLQPGQSRPTQNLTTARTCGFHDHLRETDTGLQGTIRIQ
jgi:plastocyanin